MGCVVTKVRMDPSERRQWIRHNLWLDGLPEDLKENPKGVYCAVPLTQLPPEEYQFVSTEHDKIKRAIVSAGFEIYDPKDSGTNPQVKLEGTPQEVYSKDTLQVVSAKIFEFTNLARSTGTGQEEEKAVRYVRAPVIVTKKGVYTSRMSTGSIRVVVIEYDDAEVQHDAISGVFSMIGDFGLGVGDCEQHGNTLLGFGARGLAGAVCLPGLIAEQFPSLVYDFDAHVARMQQKVQ